MTRVKVLDEADAEVDENDKQWEILNLAGWTILVSPCQDMTKEKM